MRIHPVFHNSLLKPYKETKEHGPNFTHPPPEIIAGEEGHYEIKKILKVRPTQNRKSIQYLIHWKGYPDSDNSCLPAKELAHAQDLVQEFEKQQMCQTSKEGIQALQAQWKPKEGILSRASLVPCTILPITWLQAMCHTALPFTSPFRAHPKV